MKKIRKRLTNYFSEAKPLMFTSLSNLIFPFLLKVRLFFARKFEESKVSKVMQNGYNNFLLLPLRTVGLFFFFFTSLSLMVSYYSNGFNFTLPIWSDFLLKVIVLILSILLFASKKPIGFVLSNSAILPLFNIQSSSSQAKNKSQNFYSQAIFVGLIFGAMSSFIEFNSLLVIILLILFLFISYNYPEAGVLCTVFLIPFSSPEIIIYTCLITLFSYILKYLRGKRHYILNAATTVLSIFILYLLLYLTTERLSITSIGIFCAAVLPILAVNLINSSTLNKKLFTVLYTSCTIKFTFNAIMFLILLYSSQNKFAVSYNSLAKSILLFEKTNAESMYSFIVLTLPLLLSMIFSRRGFNRKVKYIVPIIFMILPVMYMLDYGIIFTVLLSVILVLSCYKKYLILLLGALPFITPLLTTLSTSLSNKQYNRMYINNNPFTEQISKLNHTLFGSGISELSLSTFNNAFSRIVTYFGIFGTLCLTCLIVFITVYCLKSIYSRQGTSKSTKEICIGTLCSTISFIVLSSFYDTFFNITNIFIFFTHIALTLSTIRSSQNDYIDQFSVREHHKACGTN